MNYYLNKKTISKPLFMLTIISVALASLMVGINIQIENGYYYSITLGESMEKTLDNNTKLLMKKYNGGHLKRGDIVSFDIYIDGKKTCAIKRIIALPNEVIKIDGDEVYINNKFLDEDYAYYSASVQEDLTLTLKDNEYFVMGDNRCDSLDSRVFGAVPKKYIIDKVVSYK